LATLPSRHFAEGRLDMNWRKEWKPLALIAPPLFLACFYLPVGIPRFDNAVTEAFELVKWYARAHGILCLIPAFFIVGVIGMSTVTGLIYGALFSI